MLRLDGDGALGLMRFRFIVNGYSDAHGRYWRWLPHGLASVTMPGIAALLMLLLRHSTPSLRQYFMLSA